MLVLQTIRENPEKVVKLLALKNFEGTEIIQTILLLDDKSKETQKMLDDNLAQSNSLAREIGILFKAGKAEEASHLKEKTSELKEVAKELSATFESAKKELEEVVDFLKNPTKYKALGARTPKLLGSGARTAGLDVCAAAAVIPIDGKVGTDSGAATCAGGFVVITRAQRATDVTPI